MFKVEWDISKAVAGLQALARRLANLRPAWVSVLAYLRAQSRLQFSSAGARSGSPWQPLSERYSRWKAVRYPGQPILRATDEMFRSLTEPDADGSIAEAEPQSLTYGTRNRKAAYHQRGNARLPQRKVLEVTDNDRREVAKLVRAHLQGQARISGFEGA